MVVGQSSAPHGKKPPGQIFQAVFRGTIFGMPSLLRCSVYQGWSRVAAEGAPVQWRSPSMGRSRYSVRSSTDATITAYMGASLETISNVLRACSVMSSSRSRSADG